MRRARKSWICERDGALLARGMLLALLFAHCGHPAPQVKSAPTGQNEPETSRIEQAWKDAVSADTIAAYKFFLRSFPATGQAEEARRRLERLRFKLAEKEASVDAYKRFLSFHSSGELSDKARQKSEAVEFDAARKAGTEDALRSFLSDYPASSYAAEAGQLLDDRLFSAAVACGSRKCLEDYLERQKEGRYEKEASRRILEMRVEAMLLRGNYDEVAAFAARNLGELEPDLRAKVEKAMPELELRKAAMYLSKARLDEFLKKAKAGELAGQARSLRTAVTKARDSKRLAKLVAVLLDRKRADVALARHVTEWQEDPALSWLRIEQLGSAGAPCSLDAILEGLASRYIWARELSFLALHSCMTSLPEEDRNYTGSQWLGKLGRGAASAAVVSLKIGALQQNLGRYAEAQESYLQASKEEGLGHYALKRLFSLALQEGKIVDARLYAAQFASAVSLELERREEIISQPVDPDSYRGRTLVLRQLFGNLKLLSEVLDELRASFGAGEEGMQERPADAWLEERRKNASRFEDALRSAEALMKKLDSDYLSCFYDPVAEEISRLASERVEAATQLGQSSSEMVIAALKHAWLTDPDRAVRKAAAEAMAEIRK